MLAKQLEGNNGKNQSAGEIHSGSPVDGVCMSA